MYLLARFFSPADFIAVPVCFLVLFFFIRARAKKHTDERIKMLYFRAFYFKILCVVIFTLLTEFYFKGGDTGLYFQATQDMRAAVADDPDNFWEALKSSSLHAKSPLFNYFYYDNYQHDITYNYMYSQANYFPPRLALIPSYIFFNSYLCINMCFGFFALGGAIRLFRTFYHFYPTLYREIAMACLFLPGVVYWGSGLLKDPITFGCVGYIVYACFSIFKLKRKILPSIGWILVCGFFLFSIKVYILLVLIMSILVWQFAEVNKLIKNKTLRGIFAGMTFALSIVIGVVLLNYFTSQEGATQYKLDNLTENIEYQQQMFENVSQSTGSGDSHFKVNTSNPVLMVLGGVTATFFRPFLWEISSPIVLLSAAESLMFLLLTLNFLVKKGVKRFFTISFSDPRMLMCFMFAFVFAVAVGTASANFGALSRYKIPCMPFYMVMLLLMYRKADIPFPKWFGKLLDFVVPRRKITTNKRGALVTAG